MTNDEAREMFERWRWPDGPKCPRCGRGNPSKAHDRRRGTWLYRCHSPCYRRYSVRTDTIMHGSALSYTAWAKAFDLLSKDPTMTPRTLQDRMGVHHETADNLHSRIMSTLRPQKPWKYTLAE